MNLNQKGFVSCNGNDNCTICQLHNSFSMPSKRYAVNVLDPHDNKIKVMSLTEEQYNSIINVAFKTTFVKRFWSVIRKILTSICKWFKFHN
jgi:hypothetical protein